VCVYVCVSGPERRVAPDNKTSTKHHVCVQIYIYIYSCMYI